MQQDVLHGLVGLVGVVVPPAAVVHEGLSGRVILRPGDFYRAGIVKRLQDSVDDVHEGRHPKLLAPGLPARLERDRRARDEQRRVDGRAEAAERGEQVPGGDSLRLWGLVRGSSRRTGQSNDEGRSNSNSQFDGHWPHSRREGVSTTVLRSSAKASIGRCNLSRISCLIGLALILRVALQAGPTDAQPSRPAQIEVVATAVPRPAQLALTSSGRLVVLSHGWRGDSAAEIYWLDPAAATPIDASLAPRLVIPFADGPRKTALGSLAVDPKSGDLFLGEENGNRIYRLAAARRLSPLAVGLNHLLGGSSLTLDREGRLVVLDYASFESQLRSESPVPPALEALAVEDYTGPLVYRINPEEDVPLARPLRRGDRVAPDHPHPTDRSVRPQEPSTIAAVRPRT